MPCDGPSKDYAHEVGDRIADVFLTSLARHNLSRDNLSLESSKQTWDEQTKKIRDAIKELVWNDHSEY